MTGRHRLTRWVVAEMLDTLTRTPDVCLVLNESMRTKDIPRVFDEHGRRVYLHRYLLAQIEGGDTKECLLDACPTSGCLNPFHFERSMRRGRRIIPQCPNGHDYTPENLTTHPRYRCKRCWEDRKARRRKGEYGHGYCRSGHKLTKRNSYYYTKADGKRGRKCRTCTIDNQRRYRERKAKADG